MVKLEELKRTKDIPTQVKDPELVDRRRRQIADAAVQLFIEKGFHKTTTRQIAGAAGFSIGSLYEYFASKEDILYMVCESIHAEVERGVAAAMSRAASQWQKRVLENELRITGLFVEALAGIANSDDLINLDENNLELAAHNIVVLGHMWTFRRWYLAQHYSIENYIQLQTDIIFGMFAGERKIS
ncbi:MAG: helix-turn-helix domain containing protein [Desulfobacterales bacterium]